MKLRAENLIKKYGSRIVANNVSVEVNQGEIVGLLGPNGAGKTTTFYMITGLIRPNEGHIYLEDKDITQYPMYRRARLGIGYLAQEASVFRDLSVQDNILAVLEMNGLPKNIQRERTDALIEEFKLEKVRKSMGRMLSGGERRRTEIARSLAVEPKFILLDEPFAAVDPLAIEEIQMIVMKLKKINIGVLITDHKVDEILSITDRAYIMGDGKIFKQGKPEILVEDPDVRRGYLGQHYEFKRKVFAD
ncbi:MAG: LPS export ABC transporter ATP-binding protein [Verrucomicrobia bacterium]|nr:LPS export ABC transporter ATP-binding protein [Cytophagales bacterium]